jgi:APA family basic amino acid/polyamine antiporter
MAPDGTLGTLRAAMAGYPQPVSEPSTAELKRTLRLPALTLYGVGTLVGGGFYALVGKVVALAGAWAPWSLLISSGVALLTALTFGELAARYPSAGGPARYAQEAFGWRRLAAVIGWTVIATGVVSAATLANAVALFLQDLASFPLAFGACAVVVLLSMVAAWGIGESVAFAIVITVLEVGGLIAVAVLAGGAVIEHPARVTAFLSLSDAPVGGVFLAAFLSFYAYIGFEDLVTVAEEVREPTTTVPRAIVLSLVFTTVLYLVVLFACLAATDLETLSEARNPMVAVLRSRGVEAVTPMIVISVFAGINGALMQIVMGSRVLYGLADQRAAPAVFRRVHPRRKTPVMATGLVGALTMLLAVLLPMVSLARMTTLLLLLVFVVTNIALVVLQAREREAGRLPRIVPVAGALTSVSLVFIEVLRVAGVL